MDFTSIQIDCERIVLQSISKKYCTEIFNEFTPDITKYMFPKPAEKIEETQIFISQSINNMKNKNELIFVILNKKNNEFLGCCGLHSRKNHDTPELGIWIKKDAHGNKFGLEAIIHLTSWSIKNIEFSYFIYPVDEANIASRKIAESLNGEVFKKKKIETMHNTFLNEVIYKINKELHPLNCS